MSSDESAAPVGHGKILEGLWRSTSDGRLAHALLFHGPRGVGKFRVARWLATGLLCKDGPGPPCGSCGPEKRVRSGNHADLFVLDAKETGEDQIRIGRIAARRDEPSKAGTNGSIDEFLMLRAHESGWRIVIVREAERMNEAAQNALLKTLEEPSRDTLIVLETDAPDRLLDTVRSRVVPVAFGLLSPQETRSVLEVHGIEPDEAGSLARWCPGAPGKALERRRQGAPVMRGILYEALRGEHTAPAVVAALWAVDGEFEGKTAAASTRQRARVFLDLGLEIMRDVARAAEGLPVDALAHGDLVPGLALRFSRATLGTRVDRWLEARQDVDRNLAAEGVVERALMALAIPETASAREVRNS